jgi:predicted nucleotidyltransferase
VNPLTKDQADALRQLADLWKDTRFCLIGASALACQMELPRKTGDLDISVSVSLDELEAALPRLHAWRRNPGKEHEWLSPKGIKVDVLPAGPALIAAGEIVWPGTGARMNLTGMRLALERGVTFEVEAGLWIPVAPVPVIAVLKMVSYLDRPAERERDLHDIAHILENYVSPDDERRFAPEVPCRSRYERQRVLLGLDLRGC